MSNSNRGGARSGAGRPKLEIVKIPAKSGFKFQFVGIPDQMWQEFKEAAHDTLAALEGKEPQEADYIRLADLAMIDGIHRYINQKKKAKD
jgi:hypothetical protein